jgi:hypothetical protein
MPALATGGFTEQIARTGYGGSGQWSGRLEDQADSFKFLIWNQDAKFTAIFDAAFTAIGMRIIAAPEDGCSRCRQLARHPCGTLPGRRAADRTRTRGLRVRSSQILFLRSTGTFRLARWRDNGNRPRRSAVR